MRTSAEGGFWGKETGVRACPAKHNLKGSIIVPEANLPRPGCALLLPLLRHRATVAPTGGFQG